MSNTKQDTSARKGKLTSTPRVAIAICAAYGILPQMLDDAAGEVMFAMLTAPRKLAQAAAHRAARRYLAKQLGVTRKSVPVQHVSARAVSEYESHRKRLEEMEHEGYRPSMINNYDYQSRRFAIENGVCPRCTRTMHIPKNAETAVCECGFMC